MCLSLRDKTNEHEWARLASVTLTGRPLSVCCIVWLVNLQKLNVPRFGALLKQSHYSVFRYIMLMCVCTHLLGKRLVLSDGKNSDVTLAQGPMEVRYTLVWAEVVSLSTEEVPVCLSSEFFTPTQRWYVRITMSANHDHFHKQPPSALVIQT
jgi:hypothetical protein